MSSRKRAFVVSDPAGRLDVLRAEYQQLAPRDAPSFSAFIIAATAYHIDIASKQAQEAEAK